MKQTRILVVDDEPRLVRFVRANLESVGYNVDSAGDGRSALRSVEQRPPDLIILDIMLPDLDGFEVCRLVREFSSVPIIMLTARAEESDKVRGLNLGADDYLTKPFGAEELLARVKAVLRRARPTPQPRHPTFQTGDLRVDFARHTVTVRGRPVKLSPTEFNLLQYLAIHAGQVLPHEDILKAVWGPEYRDETEYLRVYIRYLRQKIEDDPSHPSYILTEPGVGYMLRAAETAVPSSQRP